MRFAAAISTIAVIAAAGSLALAQTPSTVTLDEPSNRFKVDAPKDWPADFESKSSGRTVIMIGVDPECQFHTVQDDTSAAASPDAIRASWAKPIGPQKWIAALNPFRDSIFENANTTLSVADETVDDTSYFPIQRALVSGNGKTVTAAVFARPGFVVYGLCRSWDKPAQTGVYEAIFRSLRTPADTALAAQGEASAAARAAAAEAAAKANEAAARANEQAEQAEQAAAQAQEAPKRKSVERVLRK